jgi:predicted ribosome quality control (RQC) complex YloA/Tae2 family protein
MLPDGLTLNLVVRELQATILQGRVERVYQPEKQEIILVIRYSGRSLRLLISSAAESARIHLTTQDKTNPPYPPLFCQILRKYLEGSRLSSIEQENLDRIVRLVFTRLGESGEFQNMVLISEIMGKHSNLILVDAATGLIIDGIKRYSHALSRHREVLPGLPYIPPPPQNRAHLLNLDEEQFVRLLLSNHLEKKLEDVLMLTIAGIGRSMAREVVYRAGLDPELRLEFCGEYELHALFQSFQKTVIPLLRGNKPEPVIIFQGTTAVDYAPLPLTHYRGLKSIPCETVNEMLDRYYAAKAESNRLKQIKTHLETVIRQNMDRCSKKLTLQEKDEAEAREALKLRLLGEMIFAHLHLIRPGSREVELPNLYQPDAPSLKIELDPSLSAVQNAQRLFRRYDKARDTIKALEKQIKSTKEEIQYLNSIKTALEQAECLADYQEIHEELEDAGYIRSDGKKSRRSKGTKKAPPQIMRFTSRDGYQILVGKNNQQNDYITMRLARDEDYWLHVKDSAGAHVIVKSKPGQEIPPSTLEEAAGLAAHFSEARYSSKVPVDCTKRKYVSKPAGARPGFVIYKNHKTIYATPKAPTPE